MRKEYNHTGHASISTNEYRVAGRNIDLAMMRDSTLEERESIQEHIDEISVPTGINFYDKFDTPSACVNCSNNPKNGGSGICNCILGSPIIY